MRTIVKPVTNCSASPACSGGGEPSSAVPAPNDYCAEIMDNVNDALFTVDLAMTVTSYNQAAELMTGVPKEKALGQKCYQIFKTSVCGMSCPVKEALQKQRNVVTREIVMQDQNGGGMPVLLKAAVLYDRDGVPTGAVESMRCLRRLYSIIDSVADGLFTVNEQMQITNFNKAAEELTGIPHEQALGRHCKEVFKTNCCDSECPIKEAMATGQAIQRDIELADKSGNKKVVSAKASVLYDCTGRAIGGVETLRDMSPIFAIKEEMRRKYTFQRMVSRNAAMRRMFDIMEDIAVSDATVFLHGESGTGKELLAHAIHDLSQRRNQPMVTVNCGALPETLLESEIFGVRKGAFTGATENRSGRIEQCHGGTFFLDEIGDLPLQLQVKLLRLLENREYQPLGARHTVKADVRFIAASHRNLEQMVQNGTFRQDLYFRINIITLHVPPLRERIDDIPLLLDSALQRFNSNYNKKVLEISPEVMQRLLCYRFPGNIRELLNIIEQAVILCRGHQITMDHMPHYFKKAMLDECVVDDRKSLQAPADTVVRKVSEDRLAELLMRHQGNRNAVASALGVDRTTLWRWMNRYGMLQNSFANLS